jgi:hypothetical protein
MGNKDKEGAEALRRLLDHHEPYGEVYVGAGDDIQRVRAAYGIKERRTPDSEGEAFAAGALPDEDRRSDVAP